MLQQCMKYFLQDSEHGARTISADPQSKQIQ
jgi:hypothetical protein